MLISIEMYRICKCIVVSLLSRIEKSAQLMLTIVSSKLGFMTYSLSLVIKKKLFMLPEETSCERFKSILL